MKIYVSYGYSQKDASIKILKNNIYGLDIDDRAYQLAYFSIMMLARSFNKTLFNDDINPNLYSIKEYNQKEIKEIIVPEVYIDKKGNVRRIHSGFNGPGTGVHYKKFSEEFTLFIENLIAE